MREVKNPYPPNDTRHGAFERGVEHGEKAARLHRDQTDNQSVAAECSMGSMRPSATTMIGIRVAELQAEIDGLQALAKFATAMENTPADELLWKLIAKRMP